LSGIQAIEKYISLSKMGIGGNELKKKLINALFYVLIATEYTTMKNAKK